MINLEAVKSERGLAGFTQDANFHFKKEEITEDFD